MNRVSKTVCRVLLVICLLAVTVPLHGAIQYWDGEGGADNNYHTAINWYNADLMYDNMVPGPLDDANIDNGGTVLINQDVDVARLITGRSNGTAGHVEVTNGVVNISTSFYLAYQQDTVSHFVLSGGTVNSVNRFLLAAEKRSVGTFRQTGGTMSVAASSTQWTRIGYLEGSYGYYDLSGGVLELGPTIVGNNGGDGAEIGVGIIDQTGGDIILRTTGSLAAESSLRIGTNGGAVGVYNLTGGTCQIQTGYLAASSSGAYSPLGLINIGGTGELTVDYQGGEIGYVRLGYASASTGRLADGIVNLATGGVLKAPLMRSGDGVNPATAGNGYLNFHGGTLVTNADQTDYIRLADAYIYSEGARIDTDGHDVTFNRGLLAPTGLGVQSIALAFAGDGYVGPPAVRILGGSGAGASAIATVSGGSVTGFTVTNPGSGYEPGDVLTVQVINGTSQFAAQAGTINLGANTSGGLEKLGEGTLTLGGENTYTGATWVKAGGLAVTGSMTSDVTVDAVASLSGTGTIDGNVDINGTFKVAYDSDADTIDLLTITGLLDLTGATISFSDLGTGTLAEGQYVFASYGSLAGSPATEVGLQAGWSVDYAYNGDSIALLVAGGVQIPGDADGNGVVDDEDAKRLASNWGAGPTASWAMGDFNGDRWVNALDAAIMAANWGATGAAEATAVPEPSTFAVLLAAILSMALTASRPRRGRNSDSHQIQGE